MQHTKSFIDESMAVCVRRWHDPAEKVRGRNLFVGKTRTLLSLNRKFIALSKPDDGSPGRIVVDLVTLEKNSPQKVFEQSMDARNCIWRAIRLVPVILQELPRSSSAFEDTSRTRWRSSAVGIATELRHSIYSTIKNFGGATIRDSTKTRRFDQRVFVFISREFIASGQ